jgi:hypothetical protein
MRPAAIASRGALQLRPVGAVVDAAFHVRFDRQLAKIASV